MQSKYITDTYHSVATQMIEAADTNMTEYESFGIDPSSYAWRYQDRVKTYHTDLIENIEFTETSIKGWGLYFTDNTSCFFVFAAILILCSVIYNQEQSSGFYPILRICRYGRLKTFVSKSSVLIILTCSLIIGFALEKFCIYGLMQGFSDGNNAIQILPEFVKCPYRITLIEYLLISLGIQMLTGIVFSLICATISVFLYNYVILYIAGIGVIGVNLALYLMPVYNPDNLFKHMNFISTAISTSLFGRFRAVNLFGNVVEFLPLVLIIYGIMILFCGVLTGLRVNKPTLVVSFSFLTKAVCNLKKRITQIKSPVKKSNRYSLALVNAELYKTFVASRMWIVLLILLIIKAFVSTEITYKPDMTFTDAAYKGYMTELAGEMSDEKRERVHKEREYIDNIKAEEAVMDIAYEKLEITQTDYMAYKKELEYALSRDELFTRIEDHVTYIDNMKTSGKEVWFVYDTGWSKLLNSGFDWSLYTALLLISVIPISLEYENRLSVGSFVQILKTTKRGKFNTIVNKCLALGILSFVVSIFWYAIDICAVLRSYELPMPEAPLQSIEIFSGIKPEMSIMVYTIFLLMYRIAAALSLSYLVFFLTVYVKKVIPTLTGVVLATLFPMFLTYFGFDFIKEIDFTRFLRGTPMFVSGNEMICLMVVYFIIILEGVYAVKVWCTRKG